MGKRYVYWRKPEGKPYEGADDKHAMREILAEIGTQAEVTPAEIRWHGFIIERFRTSLVSSIAVIGPDDEELNEHDSREVVWSGLRHSLRHHGGKRPIAPKEFLAAADNAAAEFFRRPLTDYTLMSRLSVASLPAKKFRLKELTIQTTTPHAKPFTLPPSARFDLEHSSLGDRARLSKGMCVFVGASGRSVFHAFQRAISELTLLRGLWTLFSTFGSWSISFGSTKHKPLGVIHSGPFHTLHLPSGEPAQDLFWYEPEFPVVEKPFTLSKGWPSLEKKRRWAIRRLRTLPYAVELEDVIRRYAIALDQSNLDVAFLHLWSILEKLTDTIGAKYDETVARTVWAYADRKLAAEMLQALRVHRNRLVRSAESGNDQEQVAYLIKAFVEPHLIQLLRNDFGVETIREYGQHLGMPASIEELKKQRRRCGRALRWMQRASAKK